MTKLTYIFLFISLFGYSQDAAKMAVAKQKLYAGEYLSALNTYREVEQKNPEDAGVKYYVGLCQYNLKQIDNARTSLEKAVAINKDVNPETYLLLGKIYQHDQKFDKAIEQFQKFGPLNKDKELTEESNLHVAQCNNAKTLMSTPVNVEVTNLGAGINSKYDDKNPCITADGNKLVFTTRRPENTNSPTDIEGDNLYFENIYIANADSATKNFVQAAGVTGAINTPAHDACTSISPDGKQIFIYFNDIKDKEKRGGNVFVSKVSQGKWRAPESLGKPINSSYWEGGACVSPDGKRYFFTSERPGGLGSSDIWMVEKVNKTDWGKPVNLGPEINSPNDEAGVFLAPDGKTLFFCSNSAKSMGSYDIFRTVYENGKWSAPSNLGYPINSPSREGQLSISADAKYAYFSSERAGGLGGSDIYKVDFKDLAILEKDGKKATNGLSILKGTIREGNEGYGVSEVEIFVKDASGNTVGSTITNENGEYFLTLRGGKYTLTVRKKGYAEINENIDLGTSEKQTTTLEKGYLIKKS